MSYIEVNKVIVKDFKRIKALEISLSSITALVGGNTSGKSSVLQAAQLGVALAQASFVRTKRNGVVERLGTISNEAVSYRPTDMLLSLRHGEPASQSKSYSVGYECTQYDEQDNKLPLALTISILRGKNANLALSFTGDEELLATLGDRDAPFSIFTPGLSGIPIREEWRTRGALDAAAMHGDANLYLRTLLDHLFTQDLSDEIVDEWWEELSIDKLPETPWKTFCTLLDKCYPGSRIYINHDHMKDRYVEVYVRYLEQTYPLDMASTGMLQIIQILAYACFYEPPLLLLDEPDAHLHADSQTRLHEALRYVVEETGTKILLATHSPQLIQLLLSDKDASVAWLDKGAKVNVAVGGRPAIPLLMELGALTVGAEVFMAKNKFILLTEDKDSEFACIFARANGANNFACLSYNGCGNLSGARQLASLICELRPDVKVVIHRDRDFRTVEEMAFEMALARSRMEFEGIDRISEIFTPLNDLEHSFIQPAHLDEVIDFLGTDELINLVADVVADRRDDLTGKAREARAVISRSLYEPERMKQKKELRAEAGISEKAPNVKKFLPANGKEPVAFEFCHGKTVFKGVLVALHTNIGGDTHDVPGHFLIPSSALRSADWIDAFSF
ncbi:AAA family ATPase [Pseudomonas bubulae]|uniref:AAA family ATPase n=1 Tax=Pseudomonas bubulae TaxID=2316085 RepID=UPI0039A3F455